MVESMRFHHRICDRWRDRSYQGRNQYMYRYKQAIEGNERMRRRDSKLKHCVIGAGDYCWTDSDAKIFAGAGRT